MIREYEVALMLSTELPGMNRELKNYGTLNVFKAVQCFADYTIGLVKENKLHLVKDCFSLAEKMIREGSGTVKTAVENVYVYSIGVLLDVLPAAGKNIREVMTPGVREVYDRHLMSNGI